VECLEFTALFNTYVSHFRQLYNINTLNLLFIQLLIAVLRTSGVLFQSVMQLCITYFWHYVCSGITGL